MSFVRRLAGPGLLAGLTTLGCGMTAEPEKTSSTTVEPIHIVDVQGVPVRNSIERSAVDYARSTTELTGFDRDNFKVTSVFRDESNHVRLQQTYDGLKVWGADVVVHGDDASLSAINGTVARQIGDLDTTPALTAADALSLAKADYASTVQTLVPLEYSREKAELIVYPTAGGPKLAWHTKFFTELQAGKEPGLWNKIIDAGTGEILQQFNGIHTLSQASGPGGNAKVPRTWTEKLDVEPSGTQYVMSTSRLQTYNMRNSTTGTGTLVTGPLNPISDAPIDDAHGYAEITLNFLQEWYGHNSINDAGFIIKSRVHYGTAYENAFWDDVQMTYGDGASTFYPLSGDVDVVAHEINHGFTSFHSDLVYASQSGGANESFSDIAGTIADFYLDGDAGDWLLGADIFKQANAALRYMCNPIQDGSSIDNFANYREGIDVHYSSGIMNKAFCRTARRLASGNPTGNATQVSVRRAGEAWYRANSSFWTSGSTFAQTCKGTLDAARALNFSEAEISAIRDSWVDVGVNCEGPPTCDETATGASGSIQSSGYPGQYPNNHTRSYCIKPANGQAVTLTFDAFNTESGYDFVTITNGTNGTELSKTSGTTRPPAATGAFLIVNFSTDSSVTATGWHANWGGGGNQAPALTITSPTAGSTVSGTVNFAATATDADGTIASVQFVTPGGTTTDTSAPYSASWNTTTSANGTYTLTARATDNQGAVTEKTVSVTVNNVVNQPPVLNITSPTAGSTVSGTVNFAATATDDGSVVSVAFTTPAGTTTDTTSPYSASWNTTTAANGTYTLTAVATDNLGVTTTKTVSVTVNNTSGPTTDTFSGSLTLNQFFHHAPYAVRAGTQFKVVLSGTGDPDVYVRWGAQPTTTAYTCRPYTSGANEVCDLVVPTGTTQAYVSVRGYTASTYTATVTYTRP